MRERLHAPRAVGVRSVGRARMCSVSNTANVSQKWEKRGIKSNVGIAFAFRCGYYF